MSYVVVNKPSVNDDILDIVAYYKLIHINLAIAFLDCLEEIQKYIFDFPLSFQIKYKNVRTILLAQYPYQIHYIINDEKKQIVIIAIIHAYRNPKEFSK